VLSEHRVAELLAAIGARTPSPASGAATALTGALAAALAELASRYAGDEEGAVAAQVLGAELVRLADEDATVYAAFMADRNDATRAAIIRVPEEIAERADEVVALALRAADKLSTSAAADAEAAAELARAAARVARGLARFNAAS
jgi:formiminotetrahydrofolate cyclodeaminase